MVCLAKRAPYFERADSAAFSWAFIAFTLLGTDRGFPLVVPPGRRCSRPTPVSGTTRRYRRLSWFRRWWSWTTNHWSIPPRNWFRDLGQRSRERGRDRDVLIEHRDHVAQLRSGFDVLVT